MTTPAQRAAEKIRNRIIDASYSESFIREIQQDKIAALIESEYATEHSRTQQELSDTDKAIGKLKEERQRWIAERDRLTTERRECVRVMKNVLAWLDSRTTSVQGLTIMTQLRELIGKMEG